MRSSWILLAVGVLVQFTGAEVFTNAKWGKSQGVEGFGIGGEEVTSAELYPWHVAIITPKEYVGGGSIISESFVLTAAHLVYVKASEQLISPGSISVKAGIVKLNDASAKQYKVAEIFKYPDFDSSSYSNDICLLKLTTKFIFGPTVRPIFLWDDADKDVSTFVASTAYSGKVVGWGLVEGGAKSNDLNRVQMNLVDAKSCQNEVPAFKRASLPQTGKSYCASKDTQNVCSGDSGGGMFLYDSKRKAYYLRGLVSHGIAACDVNNPTMFTDIEFYLKWIEKIALPKCYNLLGNADCPAFDIDEKKPLAIVHLKYRFRRNFLISDCHGVLISKKHVLTQATCVETNKIRELHTVSIGSVFINSDVVSQYEIDSFKINQDLAIIILKSDVSQSIKPVCLPTAIEHGSSSIFYWARYDPHPKRIQQVEATSDSVQKVENTLKIRVPGKHTRLGGAPFLYSMAGSHMFLRAVEKCPWQGCTTPQESAEFVDVLSYGDWIRDVVGVKSSADELLPPRCAV